MKSNIDDPIATESLILTSEGGARTPITVMIGRPYSDGKCFRCPVKVDGLEPQYADSAGETSLQALCLALRLARDRLEDQVVKGRSLSYPGEPDDDSPLERDHLAMIFGWPWPNAPANKRQP